MGVDEDAVLVSFILAWVCTIAYYTEFIPGSRFVTAPFACGHIPSMRTPEEDITEDEMEDIVNTRHRNVYSWLSTRAPDELTGKEEKCVVLSFAQDNIESADDGSTYIAYVVEFIRCDNYEENEDMIRQRTSNILKSVQVCCVTGDLSEEVRIDLDVWKGRQRQGNIEELRRGGRVIEHGRLRVGYFEFRCWMVRGVET